MEDVKYQMPLLKSFCIMEALKAQSDSLKAHSAFSES